MPGGRCSTGAHRRRDREEHFPWFAIHSHGNSISRKTPLQQMKELNSSLGKNVFQGRASEPRLVFR